MFIESPRLSQPRIHRASGQGNPWLARWRKGLKTRPRLFPIPLPSGEQAAVAHPSLSWEHSAPGSPCCIPVAPSRTASVKRGTSPAMTAAYRPWIDGRRLASSGRFASIEASVPCGANIPGDLAAHRADKGTAAATDASVRPKAFRSPAVSPPMRTGNQGGNEPHRADLAAPPAADAPALPLGRRGGIKQDGGHLGRQGDGMVKIPRRPVIAPP